MAKFIVSCTLLLAVALAAQKDTIQDLGAVQMIQDDSSMGDDVVYRISFRTQFDSDPAKTASKGTFTIKITGTDGDTGDLTLVSHPGYVCNAKSDAECFPGIDGTVLDDPDGDRVCACDPAASGYDEDDAKWEAKAGLAQSTNLKAADVGEITGVTITSDAAETDSWTPVFLKVNMNDMASGLGNGIYYMDIGKAIDSANSYDVTTTATDADGNTLDMTNMASHNSGIIKCEAAACEEKMEKKLKATN
jgi:hypothetical protein